MLHLKLHELYRLLGAGTFNGYVNPATVGNLHDFFPGMVRGANIIRAELFSQFQPVLIVLPSR